MADRRILFFGDSFTVGVGDPTALGWVGRVAAAAMPLTAYNLGARHETSEQVAARWRAEAAPRTAPAAAYGVVFSVGSNDVTGDGSGTGATRVAHERSVATLGALLDGAAELALPAFVVGPPPLCDADGDARLLALCDAFAALCAARRVPYVPLAARLSAFAPWREEARAGDGAHPAARGYARAAELVLEGGFAEWVSRC